MVVVNKPPGLPCHSAGPGQSETVASFLAARYPEMLGLPRAEREAGLVHRLDTPTSGVLVAARTRESYEKLREAFSRRRVWKFYVALLCGAVEGAGRIELPLAHKGRSGRMVTWGSRKARGFFPALTLYRPLFSAGTCTVVAAVLKTGVTHQLRVHFSSIGHPVVGDAVYGRPGGGREARGGGILFLHARRVSFPHPATSFPFSAKASFPRQWKWLGKPFA
jgi:Pseudouridylate synthases, 23S RNA-specific